MVRAALYRPDGTVFATYEPTSAWTGEQFSVTREIVEGGQLLGSAELVTRSQLGERVLAYSGIVLAVMALALGAALVLSAWLQRVITRPILDIDAAARNVIQGNDYAIRARKSTEDEIGALADAFNRMLDEIHRRTAELGESEVRFRTLADSAPVLMWLNDDNGAVFVNKAYLDFLGVTGVVDVQRLDWAQFVHPEDRAAYVESYLEAARSGRVFSREFRFRRHDGQYRWMRSVGVPRVTQDGAMRGYTGCTFDVHDAREAAEALRAADRRTDEFLATLAHELRNPLAPIRNALEILRLARDDPVATQKAREMMQRQVSQMVRLIDDLLDVSRINTGKLALQRERIDVAAVARSAIEAVEPAIKSRQHRLVVSLPQRPLHLTADPTRLAQVFLNLLNNAVKFTEAGGEITFALGEEDGALVARVRDTGIGLPAHQLEPIFEMFNQADRSLERTAGGLGVGLALSRRLVELHGGSIEARSEGEGKGSEFVVRIPGLLDAVPANNGDASADGAGHARPVQRILIVDDNEDFAASLAAVLRKLGRARHRDAWHERLRSGAPAARGSRDATDDARCRHRLRATRRPRSRQRGRFRPLSGEAGRGRAITRPAGPARTARIDARIAA